MTNNLATRLVAIAVIVGALFAVPRIFFGVDPDPQVSHSSEPQVAQMPHFETHWQGGKLLLAGHTTSAAHEQALLDAATSLFPNAELATDFKPQESMPDYWTDSTVQMLLLLAETASGSGVLGERVASITGVTTNSPAFEHRLDTLREALPDSVDLTVDRVVIEANTDSDKACERAFSAFRPGPINFEESTATFRSAAYPRMDRIVALARNCRKSTIEIVGHTDSSGDLAWNELLSVNRAQAVADYLVEAGISRDRLVVRGAGPSLPVADNRTRYGRSKNRRIEVKFRAIAD